HSEITIGFDLFIIRTWDGNDGFPDGPDMWTMRESGSLTPIINTSFSVNDTFVAPDRMQSYPSNYPASFHSYTGASESNTLGYVYSGNGEAYSAVYKIQRKIAHTNSTLALEFEGGLSQAIWDESWGLDNVY